MGGAYAGIEPVALGARTFLIVETEKRSVSDDRLSRGPKDAFGTAVSPNHEEVGVDLHCGDPPSRGCVPKKRSRLGQVPCLTIGRSALASVASRLPFSFVRL